MEVHEHLINPQETLYHLLRISRKRVIITVPYDEKLKWVLCVHCARYTPKSGHLHAFNEEKIRHWIDSRSESAQITKLTRFGSLVLWVVPGFIPYIEKRFIDNLFCFLLPRWSRWLLVVIDLVRKSNNH